MEHPSIEQLLAPIDRAVSWGTGRVAPAAVIQVVQGTRTIFERAYGYLDPLDEQRPTQLDSVFDLASVTKLFTFTAFFRLVTENRVSVDTPVRAALPAFDGLHPIGGAEDPITKRPVAVEGAFAGQMVDRSKITFRHLLTHTSGLAAWRGIYHEAADTAGQHPADVPADVRSARIAKIYDYPFIYPPGDRSVYSDLGLILLGEAVAQLSGEPLEPALRRLVLEPLGIAGQVWFNPLACNIAGAALSSRIAPTEYCAWRERRLLGEVHDENAAGLGGVAGHAGLFATAEAAATLGKLYLNGGSWNGKQLIDTGLVAESLREQVHFADTRRGLGWVLYDNGAFGHTGYTGTSIRCGRLPRHSGRDMIVVLLTNRVYYGRDSEGIVRLRTMVYQAVEQVVGAWA